MTDLRSHLERIGEDGLLELASLWLPRVEMPFNRQKVVHDLVSFFSSSSVRNALVAGVDRGEAGILTIVDVLSHASRDGIVSFFPPSSRLMVERDIDRLLRRTLLLVDEDGMLTLSSSLDYSPVLSREVFASCMRRGARRIRLVETLKAMMALVNISKVRNTPAAIRRLARNSSYIFPILEEDEVITLMEDFVATALTLSIMTDGPQRLAIDVDRAAWFFRQPLVRIKASLLCNGQADAAGLALASLAMWLEDDAATALLKASCAQEEVDEVLLKRLSSLSFIMGDDEDDGNDDEVLVTDDLTLRTSSSGRDATLWLFTSPVLVDRMLTLQITRESVEAGFDAGLDVETMEAHLKTPSPLVNDRLRMWRGRYDEFRFTRGICLETSERNARIIAQLPLLKIHIIAQLSSSAFLMKASSEEQWRRILVYSGFDMLPHTITDDEMQAEASGDGVKEREQETVIGCGSIGSLPQETYPGDLSYRTDLEDAIEERIEAQDRQAYMDMLEAGYILSKEQIVPGRHLPKLRSASGFDHQARLGLLNAALGDHSMLALTTADGTMKAFVTLVEKCGRSRNVTVVDENGDEHVIPVERIFRVREILS